MKIYIHLKSYNAQLLDSYCSKVFQSRPFYRPYENETRAVKMKSQNFFDWKDPLFLKMKGPISLPTKKKNFSIIRSPHVYNLSKERFFMRVHRRLFIINVDKNFNLINSNRMNYTFRDRFLGAWPGFFRRSLFYDIKFITRKFARSVPAGVSLKISLKNVF
mgnify:CR=1 FL=1